MNKPLKIFAIAISAILLIIGIGIAYLSLVFDPNQFKSQLIDLVKDKKHRTLTIDGNIQLTFFPKLGVSLEKIKLSEFESASQFAALEKAQISLAIMPLLSKQIVVDKIALHGMQLRYQRDAEGKSNIDDLFDQKSADTTTPTKETKQSMRFAIEGIDIANSQFEIDDQKAELLGSVQNLNLSTGNISNKNKTPVKFSADIKLTQPKTEAHVELATALTFDLEQKNLDLENFKTQITGKVGVQTIQLQIDTPAMHLNPQKSDSAQLSIQAKSDGAQSLTAQLTLKQLTMFDKKINLGAIDLHAEAKQGAASKLINLKSSLSMNTETSLIQLPQLAIQLAVKDPKLAQPEITIPITGHAAINLKDKTIDTTLAAKFDESQLQTAVQIQNFSEPAIRFKLDIDKLNLDRYIKPSAPNSATENKEEDLNLSSLQSLNLSGTVKIAALQVKNLHINQVQLPIKAAKGEFSMTGIAAQLYQGSVVGNMHFDVDGNHFQMQQTLSNVQINPLLVDFMKKDIVEGRGTLSLQINTHGKRVSQFKENLNGTIRTQLADGAVKGINLAKSLREFKAKILNRNDQQQAANRNEKTDFSAMSASINFVDGVGNSDDLDMKSPFLRVGGKGQVNLRNNTLDYTARATIVNTAAGQDGADLAQLKDLTIPVRISGPFDKLGYQLQFAQIGSEALKSAFKAKAAPALDEKKKELKEKVNEQLKDKLKGLFSR